MFYEIEKYLNKPFPKNATFLEVGANKGQWTQKIIAQYPRCFIYAFEPIPQITPSYPNVKLTNCAIDIKENENRVFYVTNDNVTSSLLPFDDRVTSRFVDFTDGRGVDHKKSDLDVVSVIKVETQRLDNFIFTHNIDEVHYLKIDAEGNDLNVFKSLGDRTEIVWSFEMEVWNRQTTLFQGSYWRDTSLKYVQSKGFTLVERFIHGRGLSTDLLFVNNDLLK